MRVLLVSVGILTLAGDTAAAHRRITISEAKRLAWAALGEETKSLPGVYLEPPPVAPRNGAKFEVLWGGASGRDRAQSLVVDIETAEVWDSVTCRRLATPRLRTIQKAIRSELKIPAQEVERALAQAQTNGCSNLIDPRPKRSDFGHARVITVSSDQNGQSKYTVTWGGCDFKIVSPVPLDVRDGEVKFEILADRMYVIDDRGEIREAAFERSTCI